jgi:hypothetical protein
MKNKINFECFICDKIIEENNRMFSVDLCIERERDGAYDVDTAEGLLTICESCSITHDVQDRIQNEAIMLVESSHDKKCKPTKPEKITAINSRYDCQICGQHIPNNFQILTLSSGYERYAHGSITPEDGRTLHMVTCVKCSDEKNLKPQINAFIDRLITETRRESFRVVK